MDMLAQASAAGSITGSAAPRVELTVVVPTFNARTNVPLLVERLSRTLADWEIVFVDDDSPDHTGDAVREIARSNTRVRVIDFGSAGAGSPPPRSRASSPRPHPISPSWTPTFSTTRQLCRRCSAASRRRISISSSAAAM
jgi:hypothetical protein